MALSHRAAQERNYNIFILNRKHGWSYNDIARHYKLTPQRISQIIAMMRKVKENASK